MPRFAYFCDLLRGRYWAVYDLVNKAIASGFTVSPKALSRLVRTQYRPPRQYATDKEIYILR